MQKLLVANWKSNKTQVEVKAWLDEFKLESNQDREIIIAAPFPFLSMVAEAGLSVAVQDISPFSAGSYTGAVGVQNLSGLGVKYTIVGHSERRKYFKESHQDVANKIEQAVNVGITPIVCIDTDYLAAQAQAIASEYLEKCIVTFEPPEAISTNQADEASIKEVVAAKERILKVFGNVKVLYGGNVNPKNIADYIQIVDGVLVGGASLDALTFTQLVQKA